MPVPAPSAGWRGQTRWREKRRRTARAPPLLLNAQFCVAFYAAYKCSKLSRVQFDTGGVAVLTRITFPQLTPADQQRCEQQEENPAKYTVTNPHGATPPFHGRNA